LLKTRRGIDLTSIARQWLTNGVLNAGSNNGTARTRVRLASDYNGEATKEQIRSEHL